MIIRAIIVVILINCSQACFAQIIYNVSNQYDILVVKKPSSASSLLLTQGYPKSSIDNYLKNEFLIINSHLNKEDLKLLKVNTKINFHYYKCYKNPKHDLCRPSRTRSLRRLYENFYDFDPSLESVVQKLPKKNLSFLEIGMGYGRILAELASRFEESEFWGLKKRQSEYPKNYKELARLAEFYDVPLDPKRSNQFKLVHKDLSKSTNMPFGIKYNIIVSQKSIKYMKDKYAIFKEIHKRLKVGGYAFLQFDYFWVDGAPLCEYLRGKKSIEGVSCDNDRVVMKKLNKSFPFPKLKVNKFQIIPNKGNVYFSYYTSESLTKPSKN